MAKTITLTCLVHHVQMTRCAHCQDNFPMISLGIGKAYVSGEPDIFSGKIRNEEKKTAKLRDQATANAAKDLEGQKLRLHRCLVCGKFDENYLEKRRANYRGYRTQWWKDRFFHCLVVPIAIIAVFLISCFLILVIEGLVLGIRAFFAPVEIKYMDWVDRSKWASIPPAIILLWIIYLCATQVEFRRPLTEYERNHLIDRLNCNESVELWLRLMDQQNNLIDRILLNLPNEKTRFFDVQDDSDETRWIRLRYALHYEPTKPISFSRDLG